MHKLLAIFFLLVPLQLSAAQDTKQALVKELLQIMDVDSTLDAVFLQMDSMMADMSKELEVSDSERDIFDEYRRKFSFPKKEFELFQQMVDNPISNCPDCNGQVRRLIGTGAGIIYKGSGFYTTDYRSESYKKSVKADNKK